MTEEPAPSKVATDTHDADTQVRGQPASPLLALFDVLFG
jgi:hypothetical protein